MSHFTVLVIGDNVEEQLAPFQENNMGDCPGEYMEFDDQEDEWKADYENGTTKRARHKTTGELVDRYDERFKVKEPNGSTTYKTSDDWEWVDVPTKEVFATFEEWVKSYHGQDERDPETGRYGYWSNPNARWDWYTVGGRWSGFFKLKDGKEGELGESGAFGNKPTHDADIVRKGDVDFEGMRNAAGFEAAQRYAKVWAATSHLPPLEKTWEQCVEEAGKAENGHTDYDKARKLYQAQPRVHAFHGCMEGWHAQYEEYLVPIEQYIAKARDSAIETYAVLKDGEWYQRGEMGWFGMSSNEMPDDEWNKKFNELIDSLPDDTRLTVVDCHI